MVEPAFCSRCGASRSVATAFCSQCGLAFTAPLQAQAVADAQAREANGLQAVAWILFIPAAAGFVWLWLNIGIADLFWKVLVVGFFGAMWTAFAWVVIVVAASILGFGYLLFRRPGK